MQWGENSQNHVFVLKSKSSQEQENQIVSSRAKMHSTPQKKKGEKKLNPPKPFPFQPSVKAKLFSTGTLNMHPEILQKDHSCFAEDEEMLT